MKTNAAFLSAIVLIALVGAIFVSTVVSAQPPDSRVYSVPEIRTTNKDHKDAMVIVGDRTLGGATYYDLFFYAKNDKYNGAFQCDKAKYSEARKSLHCEKEQEKESGGKIWVVRESLGVGRLEGAFCNVTRDKATKAGKSKAVMKSRDCSTSACMCYEIEHECRLREEKKYTNSCPDFGVKAKSDKDKYRVLIPPGRGAGSGGSN